MRLLGWMHKKSKQTSNEQFKDFKAGNYCTCISAQSTLDDYIPEKDPSYVSIDGSGLFQQPYAEFDHSFPGIGTEGVHAACKDIASIMNSDLFHGFLTIGTLGLEPITQPATPTFPISSQATEEKADVTENDLKLISQELEKFLEAEAEDEANDESLGRISYVSTVTLSGIKEGGNTEDSGNTSMFPLQGYLFGTQIEVPEMETRKEKVTLGDMFQRTQIIDEISTGDRDKEKKSKRVHGSTKHFFKTMLKKFPSGNQRAPNSNETMNTVTVKKRLNKVLKMFSRKVHPENLAGTQECDKSYGNEEKKTQHDDDYALDLPQQDAHTRDLLPGFKLTANGNPDEEKVGLLQYGLSGNNSSRNREYWIKTDANYLVLEL